VEGRTPPSPGQVGLRLDQYGGPTAVLIPRRRADDDRSTHRVARARPGGRRAAPGTDPAAAAELKVGH